MELTQTPQGCVMAVTEQTTWLSRIGSWFRRGNGESADSTRSRISDDTPANNDDGNLADVLGNGGNSLMPNPIEPRSTFLRPFTRRPDPNIEQLRSAVGALGELMTGIKDSLENNAKRQDEMLQYLSHLPQALQQLPESARVQGEAL